MSYPCVCGSGKPFDQCCEPHLNGKPAPTAETLMRSRYAAYVVGNIDYLQNTSAEAEQKNFNRKEAEEVIAETTWQGLEVYSVTGGSEQDTTGQIDFVFRFSVNGEKHVQHEIANFCRENGAWRYESSVINPKAPPARVEQIGRNDPCACGSGKKYKKCCGA